ncbi:MAG: hypothetical protein CSA26_12760, partial [Desulfobacterales bacterium]
MQKNSRGICLTLVLLTAVFLFVSGCAAPVGQENGEGSVVMDCVAVLPVTPQAEPSLSARDMVVLQKGSAYATR